MEIYLKGWDAIREEREARLRRLGLLSDEEQAAGRGVVPASQFIDRTRPVPAWEELLEEQRHDLARRMAIYAAMIDIMDRNIGRLVEELRDNGQLENTLLLFLLGQRSLRRMARIRIRRPQRHELSHPHRRRTRRHGTTRNLPPLRHRLGQCLLHPRSASTNISHTRAGSRLRAFCGGAGG